MLVTVNAELMLVPRLGLALALRCARRVSDSMMDEAAEFVHPPARRPPTASTGTVALSTMSAHAHGPQSTLPRLASKGTPPVPCLFALLRTRCAAECLPVLAPHPY